MHPLVLPVMLRVITSACIPCDTHQLTHLDPQIRNELWYSIWSDTVWNAPHCNPTTYQYLCARLCISRVSVHCHWEGIRSPSPSANDCQQNVLPFPCRIQRTDEINVNVTKSFAWSSQSFKQRFSMYVHFSLLTGFARLRPFGHITANTLPPIWSLDQSHSSFHAWMSQLVQTVEHDTLKCNRNEYSCRRNSDVRLFRFRT